MKTQNQSTTVNAHLNNTAVLNILSNRLLQISISKTYILWHKIGIPFPHYAQAEYTTVQKH